MPQLITRYQTERLDDAALLSQFADLQAILFRTEREQGERLQALAAFNARSRTEPLCLGRPVLGASGPRASNNGRHVNSDPANAIGGGCQGEEGRIDALWGPRVRIPGPLPLFSLATGPTQRSRSWDSKMEIPAWERSHVRGCAEPFKPHHDQRGVFASHAGGEVCPVPFDSSTRQL